MCALNVKIDKFAHYSINFYHRQIAHLIAFSVQMAKQCGVSLRRYSKNMHICFWLVARLFLFGFFLKNVEISALISDYLLKIFITLQKLVFIALSRDNFALGKIETLYHKSLFVT